MRVFLPLLLLSLALPARADEIPRTLIAALSMDWNNDDEPDAVLLWRGTEDTAELQVFEGDFNGLQPLHSVTNAVYAGHMAGQAPGFVRLTDTSFAITSEQTGIGRLPWMARVTVAYRDGALHVAGYTHDFYDRLDPEHWGTCDVNLLTGRYEITRGPGTGEIRDSDAPLDIPETRLSGFSEPAAFPVSDLTAGYFADACSALFE